MKKGLGVGGYELQQTANRGVTPSPQGGEGVRGERFLIVLLDAIVAASLIAGLVASPPAQAAPRRFALVVGQNAGGPGDPVLRFAEADARRVLQVLTELGGVESGDAVALFAATADRVHAALDALRERLGREAQPGDQLLIYVSSHADEGELHLAGTHFRLSELNEFLGAVPVSVAILILDSCRSGVVTRLKGLKPVSGVAVNVEVPEVRGRVIISSSGADEYAQESDSLSASYFTHHLVAGLRGAADASRDGQVTLQEAFAYAYARTVESTFATRGGVQHPTFHVDLKGEGDLVLSDLSRSRGLLSIDVEAAGQWLVVSKETGSIVGQFEKAAGSTTFAVTPGVYRVGTRTAKGSLEALVTVPDGGTVQVRQADLVEVAAATAQRKGGSELTWSASVGGATGTAVVDGLPPLVGGEARARVERSDGLFGLRDFLSASVGFRYGQSATYGFVERETDIRVGAGLGIPWKRVEFRGSLEAGGIFASQTDLPSQPARLGLEPYVGAEAGGEVHAYALASIYVQLSGGVAAVRRDPGGVVPTPYLGAGVGLALAF